MQKREEIEAALVNVCLECAHKDCKSGVCDRYREARRALNIVDRRGHKPTLHKYNGEWQSLNEIATRCGIAVTTLRRRMDQGDTLKKAIQTGPGRQAKRHEVHGEALTLMEWAQRCGVTYGSFQRYKLAHGLSVGETVAHFLEKGERR